MGMGQMTGMVLGMKKSKPDDGQYILVYTYIFLYLRYFKYLSLDSKKQFCKSGIIYKKISEMSTLWLLLPFQLGHIYKLFL